MIPVTGGFQDGMTRDSTAPPLPIGSGGAVFVGIEKKLMFVCKDRFINFKEVNKSPANCRKKHFAKGNFQKEELMTFLCGLSAGPALFADICLLTHKNGRVSWKNFSFAWECSDIFREKHGKIRQSQHLLFRKGILYNKCNKVLEQHFLVPLYQVRNRFITLTLKVERGVKGPGNQKR